MYTKKNSRMTFRSNRRSYYKRNNNFSSHKVKNKGNVTQQYNKYLKLAKEVSSSGDRIQAEYYYQFTDHYYRLMLELGINLDEGEVSFEEKTTEDNSDEIVNNSIENSEDSKDSNDEDLKNLKGKDEKNKEELESIHSVPFISQPVKKKPVKNKKNTV